MRHRIASILFFMMFASLALACEAVSHANDFEPASQTQTVESCGAGALSCNGTCTTVSNDQNNCGACGKVCPAGQLCSSGSCGSSCTGGLVQCGSKCVDTQNDPDNCGQCGGIDGGSCPICQNGVCRTTCLGGKNIKFCKNKKQCIDTQSDPSDCGDCVENGGVTCGASQVCSAGVCGSSCGAGLTQCDGACYDLSHDAQHCGATCETLKSCPVPDSNGVAVCIPTGVTPSCGVACDVTYEYCVVLGPEGQDVPACVNTATDVNNCGTCGHRCTSGTNPACAAGTCVN